MTRLFAAALIAATFAPAVASASTYSAKPIAPVAAKRIIARDISWACGPATCQTTTDNSRPLVLCQGLAKKAGRLERFVVDGRALPVAELDKCNTAARDGAAPLVASAN